MVTLARVRDVLKVELLEIETKIATNKETIKLFEERKQLDKKLDKCFEIKRKLFNYKPTRRLTKEMFKDIDGYADVINLDNYLAYTIEKVLLKIDRNRSIIGHDFIRMNGSHPNEVELFLRFNEINKNLRGLENLSLLKDTYGRRIERYGVYLAGSKWVSNKEAFNDLEFYKTIQTEFTDLITTPGLDKNHLEYFFKYISSLGSAKEDSVEILLFNDLKDNLCKGPEYLKLTFERWINKTEHDLQNFLLSKPLLKELHEEWKGMKNSKIGELTLPRFLEDIANLKASITDVITDH